MYSERYKRDAAWQVQLVPPGFYTARVDRIEVRRTRQGHEAWKVCLRIIRGRYSGIKYRGFCVYDDWLFAGEGLSRVKLNCSELGLDAETDGGVTVQDILGREVDMEVKVRRSDWCDGEAEENFVPLAGYHLLEDSVA